MQYKLDICESDEQVYVERLRELGYTVIAPSQLEATSVKNATQLVDFFYSTLQYYNQHRTIHYSRSRKKDLGVASKFIKARTDLCGSKKRALSECALIVKTVVKNESLFGFEEPLHSFDCFGHESMKWVLDKAISIINKENNEASDRDLNLFIQEITSAQEEESLKQLGSRIQGLKKVLRGLNDGKEK